MNEFKADERVIEFIDQYTKAHTKQNTTVFVKTQE